jgi:hypothetical protein
VDYAEAGAVDNLLTGDTQASVDPGTYTFAQVASCVGNSAPSANRVKARVRFNGTWWYTTSATGVTTPYLADSGIPEDGAWVAPADYDLATQPPATGCISYNVFANPVTLSEGGPVEMKLFFELRGLLRVETQAATFGASDCFVPPGAASDGASPYLCSTLPYLAGTIDPEVPDLQRYLVTRGSGDTASAMLYGFYLSQGTTEPVGAYSYEYFDASDPYPSAWSEIVKRVRSTSPGTLAVVNYGKSGGDVNTISDAPGGFNTTSFTLLGAVGDTSTVAYRDADDVEGTVSIRRLE